MTMSSPTQGTLGFWSSCLVAGLPIVVIFFIIPFELYYPQRVLWGEVLRLPFSFAVSGAVIMIAMLLPLLWLVRRASTIFDPLCLILFTIGLFVLLSDLFSPLQCAPLDGWEISCAEGRRKNSVEGAIAVILLLLFWRADRKKLAQYALCFALATTFIALVYAAVIAMTPLRGSSRNHRAVPSNNQPNVYHFVFDELQTDAALSVVHDLKMKPMLEGFTIFPFNSSSYLFTKSSFPNYMSGVTYHEDEPFEKWLTIFQRRGILKSLAEARYSIAMRAPWSSWDNEYATSYSTLDQALWKDSAAVLPGIGDFFPIWLARILPNFLTQEAIRIGPHIERKLRTVVGSGASYPRNINEGREPYSSVLMLKSAIHEERDLAAAGRYMYLHAILPHGPYVIDGSCGYSKRANPTNVAAYYQQTVCGMRMLMKFIQELKRLGRYDQATIIVHADTGHGLQGLIRTKGKRVLSSEASVQKRDENKGNARYPDWNSTQLYARTLSFLMIKPSGAGGRAVLSERRSKLSDIYPTLMKILSLPIEPGSEGVALFDPTVDMSASHRTDFFLYDPRERSPRIERHNWSDDRAVEHLSKFFKGKERKRGTRKRSRQTSR